MIWETLGAISTSLGICLSVLAVQGVLCILHGSPESDIKSGPVFKRRLIQGTAHTLLLSSPSSQPLCRCRA